MPNDNKGGDKRRQYDQLLEASSLGLMFPIAMGLGYLAGWGLDKLFHSKPWLTIIFTVFGVIAAFMNLFRVGLRNDDSNSQ
jgi:ATP synthase protein I